MSAGEPVLTQDHYDMYREARGLKWRDVRLMDADERSLVLAWLGVTA